MTRLIRTEWLKLATTRGPWAVIAGVLALTALITPFAMADIGQGDASRAADALEALAIGPGFITALMLLLIGALGRRRRVPPSHDHDYLPDHPAAAPGPCRQADRSCDSRRGRRRSRRGDCVPDRAPDGPPRRGSRRERRPPDRPGVAIVAAGAGASVRGVAAGSILRNQTAAILVILLWTLLVEKFFGGFFPPVLPFGAILAAVGMGAEHRTQRPRFLRRPRGMGKRAGRDSARGDRARRHVSLVHAARALLRRGGVLRPVGALDRARELDA